jgi:YHS domain-containing protein
MRKWFLLLVFLAGCATPLPPAANVREGRGYCPICVMWHDASEMQWPVTFEGKTFRFCDPNCRATFERDPRKYLKDVQFNPPP